MSTPLPARPNLDWYRKAAKQRLARMRAEGRTVQLAEAQLAVAREHGFPGWRALKTHVEATLAAALFDAIANRDLNEVERLLAAHATLIAARSPEGQTPLHAAAESNQPQIVRLLMKQGADARARYGSSAHNALFVGADHRRRRRGADADRRRGGPRPVLRRRARRSRRRQVVLRC
jgi:hypothetical protein